MTEPLVNNLMEQCFYFTISDPIFIYYSKYVYIAYSANISYSKHIQGLESELVIKNFTELLPIVFQKLKDL